MDNTTTLVRLISILIVLAGAAAAVAEQSKPAAANEARTRVFRFQYGATVHELPVGARVRVWLPVPQSNEFQAIEPSDANLPTEGRKTVEPKYGNRILHFETRAPAAGTLSFDTSYRVRRQEARMSPSTAGPPVKLSEAFRQRYLSANDRVPIGGKPLQLLADTTLPADTLAAARILYDRVDKHVRYDKSQPGYGQGDVLWVCESRFGNCTDFHSLFISLARSQGIPARFEIGFPLPPERGAGTVGGYHCWAFFYDDDRGWVPVDISEADKYPEMKEYYFGSLTEDRVTFSTGRDIDLVPRQAGAPLNFFVYPYVEVNDRVWPKERIRFQFAFRDVEPDRADAFRENSR